MRTYFDKFYVYLFEVVLIMKSCWCNLFSSTKGREFLKKRRHTYVMRLFVEIGWKDNLLIEKFLIVCRMMRDFLK